MKKSIITMAFVLLAIAAQAQIKMHSNGRITFQTLANSAGQGISLGPAPNWIADFNGETYFHKAVGFVYNSGAYTWMNCAIVNDNHSVVWAVSPDWTNVNFFVYGRGEVYSRTRFTFSNIQAGESKGKSAEPVDGQEALRAIAGLKGYYFAPDEQEIPVLEGNENVSPEAVEAMYADFSKRSVGLSGTDFEEVFPEGVRTSPKTNFISTIIPLSLFW